MPDIGTFTYRYTGFERPPTTHYMRPFYLAQQQLVQHSKTEKLCYGASPRHAVHYNHVRQMFRKRIKSQKCQSACETLPIHPPTKICINRCPS